MSGHEMYILHYVMLTKGSDIFYFYFLEIARGLGWLPKGKMKRQQTLYAWYKLERCLTFPPSLLPSLRPSLPPHLLPFLCLPPLRFPALLELI